MWTDSDLLKMAPLAELVEKERLKKMARVEAARQELAQLSAQHPLTAYDWNVMEQWFLGGAGGKRPKLSFELRAEWRSEKDRMMAARLANEARLRQIEERKAKRLANVQEVAARRAAWDAEHQEEAAKREARLALVRGRREQEAALRREQEEEARRLEEIKAEAKAFRLVIDCKVRSGGKEAVLRLSEEEFEVWSNEIATVEQLEAFGEDLFDDGRLLRMEQGPWLWRLFRAMADENAYRAGREAGEAAAASKWLLW
jgi:vacuolar-type H+-ATPase subunit I/STV1